jgi:long-chain acyl-CoA synthetase
MVRELAGMSMNAPRAVMAPSPAISLPLVVRRAVDGGHVPRGDGHDNSVASAWRRERGYRPAWCVSTLAMAARSMLQPAILGGLETIAPVEVRGRENLARLSPPAIFIANHSSHLDTLVCLRSLPSPWRRRLAVAAAADYFFADPWLGLGVSIVANAFPFARRGMVRESLARCAWLLDHGWSVLLFPEGTRSATGEVGPFRPGAGTLATSLGVPVIPLHIAGLQDVLPKGRLIPRHGPVTVTIGAPIQFPLDTPTATATVILENAVRALAPRFDQASPGSLSPVVPGWAAITRRAG